MPPTYRIAFRNHMLEDRHEAITLQTRFWRWLCLYAYRHWRNAYRGEPVGVPGIRDPLAICQAYRPKPLEPGMQPICQHPDGHYLCEQCSENQSHATLRSSSLKTHVAA